MFSQEGLFALFSFLFVNSYVLQLKKIKMIPLACILIHQTVFECIPRATFCAKVFFTVSETKNKCSSYFIPVVLNVGTRKLGTPLFQMRKFLRPTSPKLNYRNFMVLFTFKSTYLVKLNAVL